MTEIPPAQRRTPFRAGALPDEGAAAHAALAVPEAAGPKVLLADVSEFQPDVADATYLAWSKAIVIRCAYGDAHDDQAWYGGQRRALLHQGGARFVGIYQYLVAGQSGAAQAQAFRRIVGNIRPGEVFIADFEEGARPVLTEWFNEMHKLYGPDIYRYLWVYSGLNFGQAQGVLPVEWIAAYGQAEPSPPHKLWQFTDAYPVPGVGACDCSVFHGTIDELAALAYQPPGNQVEATMALTDADVALIWARQFREYIDEGGDGTLTPRTVSDFLVSAERNTVQLKQAVAGLTAAVAALQAKAGDPVDETALAAALAPVVQAAINAAGQADAEAIANAVAAVFAAKLGAQ